MTSMLALRDYHHTKTEQQANERFVLSCQIWKADLGKLFLGQSQRRTQVRLCSSCNATRYSCYQTAQNLQARQVQDPMR